MYLATMYAALTITRYRKRFVPFAFFAMALHRFPLWLNKDISFYKLMGSGKNGTFDKQPDLLQWAIFTVHKSSPATNEPTHLLFKTLYGHFIAGWLKILSVETKTYILQAAECHGFWDGKKVFTGDFATVEPGERIAVLTRAAIKLNKLKYFWRNVAPVAAVMRTSPGFIESYGIGEMPLIRQATFSIWNSREDMLAFAYGMKEHIKVIQQTRKQKWYSEEMFVRFKILAVFPQQA